MDQSDVVITPSIWYETFGFTVLEALSFGVPVIVSDHVGARDIVPDGGGIIFYNDSELKTFIANLTFDKLRMMNRSIISSNAFFDEKKMNAILLKNGYKN